jgi:hypothetical protein
MSYYRINETLSKEENLQLSEEYSEKATAFIQQFKELNQLALKEFPVNTFGMSKSKIEKAKSLSETFDRLSTAQHSYYNAKSTYELRERMAKEKEEDEKRKSLEVERSKLRAEELNDAIKYLLENGKVFGEDFTVETAIDVANEYSFDVAVSKREIQIGEGFIDFAGQNCEDECEGWNPSNRRCQCGNRRVSWTSYYHSFKSPSVLAEAW